MTDEEHGWLAKAAARHQRPNPDQGDDPGQPELRSTGAPRGGVQHLTRDDWQGDVRDWAWRYLTTQDCPSLLAFAVVNEVCKRLDREELRKFAGEDQGEEANGDESSEIDCRELLRVVHQKIHTICVEWLDDPPQIQRPSSDRRTTSSFAVKNSRRWMEDRHVEVHDLYTYFGLKSEETCGFYAVFDGHIGAHAAIYAATHLHLNIVQSPFFPTRMQMAIVEGFKKTDVGFMAKAAREHLKSGSTAVCTVLEKSLLHVAWLGDSQAVLVRQCAPPINLVCPHKPDREDERQRIEQLGGCVVHYGTWRVAGTLAVSRAFGDPEYKPYVSANPEIVTIQLDGQEDFLVLACDGLWDVMTAEDLASYVYTYVKSDSGDARNCSQHLVQMALQRGSTDNISVIVVFLRDPKELVATTALEETSESLIGNSSGYVLSDSECSSPIKVNSNNGEHSVFVPSNEEAKSQESDQQTFEGEVAESSEADFDEDRTPCPSPPQDENASETLWIEAKTENWHNNTDNATELAKTEECQTRQDVVETKESQVGDLATDQEYFLASRNVLNFDLQTIAREDRARSPSNPPSLVSFDSRPCSLHIASPSQDEMPDLSLHRDEMPDLSLHQDEPKAELALLDAVTNVYHCPVPFENFGKCQSDDEDISISENIVAAFGNLRLEDSATSNDSEEPEKSEMQPDTWGDVAHPIEVQQLIEMNKLTVSEPNSLGPLTMDEICESAVFAEDVIDDESEDGDDWCYFQGTGDHKSAISSSGDRPTDEQTIPKGADDDTSLSFQAQCEIIKSPLQMSTPIKPSMASASGPGKAVNRPSDGTKSYLKTKDGPASRIPNVKDTGKNTSRPPQEDKRVPQRKVLRTELKKPVAANASQRTLAKNSPAVEDKNVNTARSQTLKAPSTARTSRLPPQTATAKPTADGMRKSNSTQNTLKLTAARTVTTATSRAPSGTLPKQTRKVETTKPPSTSHSSSTITMQKKTTSTLQRTTTLKQTTTESKPNATTKKSAKPTTTTESQRTLATDHAAAASKLKKDHANKQISTSTKVPASSSSSATTLRRAEKCTKPSAEVARASKTPTHLPSNKNVKKTNEVKANVAEKPKERTAAAAAKKTVPTTIQRKKATKAAAPAPAPAKATSLPKADEMLINSSSMKEELSCPTANEKGSLDESTKETGLLQMDANNISAEAIANAVGLMEVHNCEAIERGPPPT